MKDVQIAVIVAAVLTCVGAVLSVIALRSFYSTRYKVRNWIEQEGRIAHAEVIKISNRKTNTDRRNWVYEVTLKVEYAHQGSHYTTTARPRRYSTPEEAQQALPQWRPGASHKVFFNPHQPEETAFYLDNSLLAYLGTIVLSGIGGIMLIVGGSMLIVNREAARALMEQLGKSSNAGM